MKTVFITGASSGIGRATVLLFQQQGWKVIATMRKPQQETELGKLPNVVLLPLDVTDQASVDAAFTEALASHGPIDVLVNNAGYGLVGIFEATTEAQIMRQFQTNVFGLMRTTHAILPHMRQRKQGVIINVSSVGGRITLPLDSIYHSTKWGVEGFTEGLHYELEPFNIHLKLIEPGAINTDFYTRSMEIVTMPGVPAYERMASVAQENMKQGQTKGASPEETAKVIFKAATDGSRKLRYPAAGGAGMILFLRQWVPFNMFKSVTRRMILGKEKF
jgi:NAD(P)-dependent dehydrogenase (short-subunit alcohol dehydrogenase family)